MLTCASPMPQNKDLLSSEDPTLLLHRKRNRLKTCSNQATDKIPSATPNKRSMLNSQQKSSALSKNYSSVSKKQSRFKEQRTNSVMFKKVIASKFPQFSNILF